MADFLKTDTPEVWTREQFRIIQFTKLENMLVDYEMADDYLGMLKVARIILRFQMEVMEEKTTNNDGNKITLHGIDTSTYKTLKDKIDELERNFLAGEKRITDPVAGRNRREQQRKIVTQIRQVLDFIFHLNTLLGLNYQKKLDPRKAALG